MDKYKIDSHKITYHIPRVYNWLMKEAIYPIYMEVSPAGACNHRCTYCGLDFMEYKSRYLEADLLKERISELGRLGLKSIMYAGEGEPFLHKDIIEIINHTRMSGIDVAVATNGVLFKADIADKILANMKWIKIGVDGATRDTYSKIHRCNPDDFDKIIKNISYAAKLKKNSNYGCTLGIQFLLLPENYHEVIDLAKMAKDIGMDYFVIKPYSQHIQSKTKLYSTIRYSEYEYLADGLEKLDSDNFNVIFRISTMKKWDNGRHSYANCLALPFWSYIDAGGDVWGCSVYLNDERFLYGNIYEESFQQIWQGDRRLKSLRRVETELDTSKCRVNCRMDEINRYLWELKNPPPHINFI